MKITVPAISATLYSILSAPQLTELRRQRGFGVSYKILIQNRGSAPFFIERGGAASATDSYAVYPLEYMPIELNDLKDIQLVSAVANPDVILFSNK